MNQIDAYLIKCKTRKPRRMMAGILTVLVLTTTSTLGLLYLGHPGQKKVSKKPVPLRLDENFVDVPFDLEEDWIDLPKTLLERPVDGQRAGQVTIQVAGKNKIIVDGQVTDRAGVCDLLQAEANLRLSKGIPSSQLLAIIHALPTASTGDIQNIVQDCQNAGFDRFSLVMQGL